MNSRASSSDAMFRAYSGDKGTRRTYFEEVHPGLVSSNVEVFIQKASSLESQLCEVVSAVISD